MAKKNMNEQSEQAAKTTKTAKTVKKTETKSKAAKTDAVDETVPEVEDAAKVDEAAKAEDAAKVDETAKAEDAAKVDETAKAEDAVKTEETVKAEKTAKAEDTTKAKKTAKAEDTTKAKKTAKAEDTTKAKKAAKAEEGTKAKKTAKAEDAVKTEDTVKAEDVAKAEDTDKAEDTVKAEDAAKVEDAVKAEDAAVADEIDKDDTFSEEDAQKMVEDASSKSSEEIRKERKELEDSIKSEREEMKNRSKAAKMMRQQETKQRRAEMKDSVVKKQVQFRESAKEMSSDLKGLLTKEIASMKRIRKTRAAEIVAIFAKHNFYIGGFSPVELRTTLEDLGPTYVKIGQIMSSRVDMLPEEYCKELEKLRQSVKELDPAVAKAVIEQETGKKINEIFKEFQDKPLGSASIGQVHSATLLDGSKVVIKVQRPLIAEMMREDFVLLRKIADTMHTIKEGNDDDSEDQIDLQSVITEFEKVTNEELDFRVEAQNTIFFKENCIVDETKISCPTIYPELTTERIMTMSCVEGYSVSKRDRMIQDGYDVNEVGATIIDNYLHQVLDVGTFHADPHQGNLMVSNGIPYWIDFGMIGHLTPANIKMIQDLILAIIQTDTEALVNAGMAMGAASPKTDRVKLTADLDSLISRYMSVTNLDELDTAALLGDVTNVLGENYIKIPGEYTMLIRSIGTIEGVIEQLCPELNLFKMITDKLLARAKKSFDLQKTLLDTGKDALALGKKATKIPVLISDVLNSVVKGRTKINLELTGYQELMTQVNEMVKAVILALFSCVLFFGSCILCMTDIKPKTPAGIPLLAVAGFIFSIALGIYTIKMFIKKQK